MRFKSGLGLGSFFTLFLFLSLGLSSPDTTERGLLSIYLDDEKVGYEEYVWTSTDSGYTLDVRGRIDSPVPMVLERLFLRLDRDFIPLEFEFRGIISGIEQRVRSTIYEGAVENLIYLDGREEKTILQIRRDSFLLPAPIFSPYMILTKKFGCTLTEAAELSAYVIPQVESPFVLEPTAESPCRLNMRFGGTVVNLETDESGLLKALEIPAQKLKVIHN